MGQRTKDPGTAFKLRLKDLVYAVPRRLAGRILQCPIDRYQVMIQRARLICELSNG